MKTLLEWASDTYSQGGEDGMLALVLERVGDGNRRCVEFGAHDGLTYSNTARLWRECGWHAVLIEPDGERFAALRRNTAGYDCVHHHGFVRAKGPDRLEKLLRGLDEPAEIDVLSIDIDGDDVYVLETLGDVQARVLLCEFNPTIPYWLDVRGKPGGRLGASLGTIARSASACGYALIGASATNAFFVGQDDERHFTDLDTEVGAVAQTTWYSNVISDYGGRLTVVGEPAFGARPGRISHSDQLDVATTIVALPRPVPLALSLVRRLRRWSDQDNTQ